MIVFIITILFLQIIISITTQDPSNIRYNSLISAQCKARCLYEYRNHHQQQQRMFIDGKTKRLLTTNVLTLPWRSIWERCPRLITCSSCLLPCDLDPPLLLSNEQNCQAICSTLKIVECEQSCLFIQSLYHQETNCSDNIPQPYNITAIERKSRRTVRLKWNSNGVNNLEPVFYVIEAQWTLSNNNNQYELVSKWGFVKEEVSNTKAIIRNIQRDNRWYRFRIAAVTRHGYSPFSITNKPFRLTNQTETLSSIIDPPKNFSVKDYQINSNTMNITLIWQKPDFPVTGYKISWESSETDQSLLINSIDTSSLEFTIPYLSLDKTHLFKIRSMILSSGNHIQMSLPIEIKFNYEDEFFSIKNIHISKPYFINGLIKTNISWNKINDYRLKQYDIYWIETSCYSDTISCCYRRDAVTIQNFFQLYDLRFNCTYLVNIKIRKKSFQFYFNVSSCELTDVYGSIRPPCQIDEKRIDVFSSLSPFELIVTRNRSGFNLYWQSVNLFDKKLVDNVFYQLRIEQVPNHIEIILVDLPSLTTNYFIPYSKNRYLNVTLSLIDNITIRQQQSILISDKREDYINSSSMIIPFRYVLLSVLLIYTIY